MPSGFRVMVVAFVTAAGSLLAGCTPGPSGSGGPQSSIVEPPTGVVPQSTVDSSGPGPTGGAAAWCALVPPSLVASTLGIQLHEPTASFTNEEIRCGYVPVSEGELTIAVRFRVDQTHDTFVAYRQSIDRPEEPTLDLSGVGDEAFYRTNEFDVQVTNIVVARQGTVAVQLEAPGELDGSVALVKAILAELV